MPGEPLRQEDDQHGDQHRDQDDPADPGKNVGRFEAAGKRSLLVVGEEDQVDRVGGRKKVEVVNAVLAEPGLPLVVVEPEEEGRDESAVQRDQVDEDERDGEDDTLRCETHDFPDPPFEYRIILQETGRGGMEIVPRNPVALILPRP